MNDFYMIDENDIERINIGDAEEDESTCLE